MFISTLFFFISLICKTKKPPGTTIGFEKSLILRSFIAIKIFLLREFSFIQSNLPPRLEVEDVLCSNAASQNL